MKTKNLFIEAQCNLNTADNTIAQPIYAAQESASTQEHASNQVERYEISQVSNEVNANNLHKRGIEKHEAEAKEKTCSELPVKSKSSLKSARKPKTKTIEFDFEDFGSSLTSNSGAETMRSKQTDSEAKLNVLAEVKATQGLLTARDTGLIGENVRAIIEEVNGQCDILLDDHSSEAKKVQSKSLIDNTIEELANRDINKDEITGNVKKEDSIMKIVESQKILDNIVTVAEEPVTNDHNRSTGIVSTVAANIESLQSNPEDLLAADSSTESNQLEDIKELDESSELSRTAKNSSSKDLLRSAGAMSRMLSEELIKSMLAGSLSARNEELGNSLSSRRLECRKSGKAEPRVEVVNFAIKKYLKGIIDCPDKSDEKKEVKSSNVNSFNPCIHLS
eukprot:TRINITY_DN11680_c0_g1_i6.p1 TRINITY_DN11680_c0_g1~~TRINITY_DN11680_c0_g1_i6.p1  ORF type:complete len:444 (+),score=75.91 TRINITY_DN11680_c0_g1_i6:157-1332(+)